MDCTQVLDDYAFDDWKEFKNDNKIQVGTLDISGNRYPIYRGENRIGRDSKKCSVVIDSKALSKEHAVIDVADNENHHLYDLGSTNKTRLGKLVLQPYIRYNIQDNATILFADIKASYHKDNFEIKESAGLEGSSNSSSPIGENECITEKKTFERSNSLEDSIFDAPTQCEDIENVSLNIFRPEQNTSDKDSISVLGSGKNITAKCKTNMQQAGSSAKCEDSCVAIGSEFSTVQKDTSCDQSLLEGDEDMFQVSVSESGDVKADKENECHATVKPGQINKDDQLSGDETDPEDFFAAQTQKAPVSGTKLVETNVAASSLCHKISSVSVGGDQGVTQTSKAQRSGAVSITHNEEQMDNAKCSDVSHNSGLEEQNKISHITIFSDCSKQHPLINLTKDSEACTSLQKNKGEKTVSSTKHSDDSGDETDPEDFFCAPTQKFPHNVSGKLLHDTAEVSDPEDIFCAPTQKFEPHSRRVSGQNHSTKLQGDEMVHKLSETISTPTNTSLRVSKTLLEQDDFDLNDTGPEDVICPATQESRRITNEMEINETPERDAHVKIQNTREPYMNEAVHESPERAKNIKAQTERKSYKNKTIISRGPLKEEDCESETQTDLCHDELFCVPTQKIDFSGLKMSIKTLDTKTNAKKQEDASIGIYSQPTQIVDENINEQHIGDHRVNYKVKDEVNNILFFEPTQKLGEADKNTSEKRKTDSGTVDHDSSSKLLHGDRETQNDLYSQPTQILNHMENKNTSGNKQKPSKKVHFGGRDIPCELDNLSEETIAGTSAEEVLENIDTDIFSVATQKLKTKTPKCNEKVKESAIGDEIFSMVTQKFEGELEHSISSDNKDARGKEKHLTLNTKTEQLPKKDKKTTEGQKAESSGIDITTKVLAPINDYNDEIFSMETQEIVDRKSVIKNSLENERGVGEINSIAPDSKTGEIVNRDTKTTDATSNKTDLQLPPLSGIDVSNPVSDEDEEVSRIFSKETIQAGVRKLDKCNSSVKSLDCDSNLVGVHNTDPVDADKKFDLSLDVELCLPQSQEVIDTLKELQNKAAIPRAVPKQLDSSSDNISSPIIPLKRKCKSDEKSNVATAQLSDLSDRIKPLNEITVSISKKVVSDDGKAKQTKKRGKDSTAKDKQKGNSLFSQHCHAATLSDSNILNSNTNLQNVNESGARRSTRERRKTWKAVALNDKTDLQTNKTVENTAEQKFHMESSVRHTHHLEEDSRVNETPLKTYSRSTKQLISTESNMLFDSVIKNNRKSIKTVNLDKQNSCDNSPSDIKELSAKLSRLPDRCITPDALSLKQLECKSTAKSKSSQAECKTPETSKSSRSKKRNEVKPVSNVVIELKDEDNVGKEVFGKSPVIVLRKLSRNKEINSNVCQKVNALSPVKHTEVVSSKHETPKTSIRVTRRQKKEKINDNGKNVSSESKESEHTIQSKEHSTSEKLLNETGDTDEKMSPIENKNSKKDFNLNNCSIRNSRATRNKNSLSIESEDSERSSTSLKTEIDVNECETPIKRKKVSSSYTETKIKIITETAESATAENLLKNKAGALPDLAHTEPSIEKENVNNFNTRKSRVKRDRNLLQNKLEKNVGLSRVANEISESVTPNKKRKVTSSRIECIGPQIETTAENTSARECNASKKISSDSTNLDGKKNFTAKKNSKQGDNAESRSLQGSRLTRGTKISPIKSEDKEDNHISPKSSNDVNKSEMSTKRRKVTSLVEIHEPQTTFPVEKAVSPNKLQPEENNVRVSRKRMTVTGQPTSTVKENKTDRGTVSLNFTQHTKENKNIPVATRKRKAASEMFINNVEEGERFLKSSTPKEEVTVKLENSTEGSRVKKTKKTPPSIKNEENKHSQDHDISGSSGGSSVKSPRSSHRLSVRPQKGNHQVLFTGLCDPKLQAAVHNLGGKVMDKPEECNVLVTDKVRRTYKFLCVMGQGKPIVSPDWLTKSQKSGRFLDPWDFLLTDKENEKKFNFCLKESLRRCGETKLLSGFCVAVTPNVKPPPEEMKGIIESCGGTYIEATRRLPVTSFIISCSEDKKMWPKLKMHGASIVGTEVLLLGILQQKLDLKTYVLT